jgi:O-acetyl-ADP-ribose deacetylase (regulator of RNase III)
MLKIVKGDLLDAKEKYIGHQTNVLSNNAGGLALYLFTRFPYANCYKNRRCDDIPGTILVMGNGTTQRYVINMMGQYRPGPPSFNAKDNGKVREEYFRSCLVHISKIKNLESIAFPLNIGCGLACGKWENYYKMLTDFSLVVEDEGVDVVLYQKD